jgi:hypothetical protein
MSTRVLACCAATLCAAAWLLAASARAEDAQSMADKFSNEAERSAAAKLEAERKIDDAAKREAELKADKEREAAAGRRAEEMRKADDAKARAKAKQQNAQKGAPRIERNPAEEAEMLARAKRDAEEAQAVEEARILAEQDAAMRRTQEELRASQAAEENRAKSGTVTREAGRTKPTTTGTPADLKAEAAAERAQLEAMARKAVEEAKERDAVAAREKAEASAREVAAQERAKAEASAREVAAQERAKAEAEVAERALAEWIERANATQRVVRDLSRVRSIRTRLAALERDRRLAALERKPAADLPVPSAFNDERPADRVADARQDETSSRLGAKLPDVADGQDGGKAFDRGMDRNRFYEARPDAPRERAVTILVVMAPGNYGIRRNGPKVADPVLCTPNGCYISAGADSPAYFLPGHKALGFGNTFGARAGACRQRLGCVFRGIELGREPLVVRPVDMHILKHDARQPQTIDGDSGCRLDGGSISCSRGIYADSYVMWVIPEAMARAVGGPGLERTLEDGLALPRSADLAPALRR